MHSGRTEDGCMDRILGDLRIVALTERIEDCCMDSGRAEDRCMDSRRTRDRCMDSRKTQDCSLDSRRGMAISWLL